VFRRSTATQCDPAREGAAPPAGRTGGTAREAEEAADIHRRVHAGSGRLREDPEDGIRATSRIRFAVLYVNGVRPLNGAADAAQIVESGEGKTPGDQPGMHFAEQRRALIDRLE